MKKKSTCIQNIILSAGLLLLAGTSNRVQAAGTTFTTTSTASGNWSLGANWGGIAPTGNQTGNIAVMSTAAGITLTLDVATTIGQVRDTAGSSRNFTINASGTTAMTFDNTGGVNNPAGNANAYIGNGSSGSVIFNPNIIIQNTDLEFDNQGSTSPTLTIGTLGTSTITAATPQNLFIRQNQATSTKSINVNSSIGSSDSVITVQNTSGGGGVSTMNLNGVVGPNAAVIQNSANSPLSLNNSGNNYTGNTTVTLGTLKLGAANAVPSSSSVDVIGTFNLNGFSDAIGALTDTGTVDNTVAGTPTLIVGGGNTSGTFSGIIQNTAGTLSFAKTGSGTETLTAAETYSGTTTVNGGTLVLSGSGALASGSTVQIGAGGTFDVSALASPYTLGTGGLKASGTGTTAGTTAATIIPASGGVFDLSSQPVSLTWGGASSGTDNTHPALDVSQGTLNFTGNTIMVIVPGTALAAGTYTLVKAAAITGTPNLTPAFGGNGHAAGTSGSLSVVGNTLVLTVVVTGTVATWTTDTASGNWTDASKWTPNAPGALPGDAATLGVGSGLTTVTLNANETLGLLTMTNNNSFIIASAGNTLTLDNTGSGAPITVTGGTANDIQTAVALNDNASIAVSSGKSLTISGIISAAGAQAITVTGAGKLALSGANTYGGGTTINAGTVAISTGGTSPGDPSSLGAVPASPTINVTLNGGDLLATATLALNANRGIGIGPVSGGTAGTALIDAASGQTFTINGTITSAGNTGSNNLTVNSLAPAPGTVVLGGANTFRGTTIISNGVLQLANTLALQNSSLNYNTGTLLFDGSISAATLGGLTGTNTLQTIGLTNLSGGPMALTVGGNNAPITYGGNWNDGGLGGSLIKAGSGTLTLSNNANYTGSTTINAGSGLVTINGSNLGSPSSAFTVGAQLSLLGGTVTASTFNLATVGGQTGVGATIGGTANLTNTTTAIGSSGNTAGPMTVNSSGNINLGDVNVRKDNGVGNGLVVAGGNVFATSVNVAQNGTLARAADLNLTGGTLTISDSSQSGNFAIHSGSGNGTLTMSGGILNYLGQDGLQMSVGSGPSVATITGGTADLSGITLNSGGSATTSTFTLSGTNASLYLGGVSGGISLVINSPSATVAATFGPGTIGGLADWTSTAPITLTNNPNFKAADAANVPHNITLNGALSGASGLTKTGNGILTLGGVDTYTGATTVSNGVLMVNGSTAGSGVDVLTSTTLGGSGTIGDSVTIENGGHTLPGGVLGNTVGTTTTIGGNLTYNAGAEADFNTGAHYNSGNGQIVVNGTLTGNINVGVNFTGAGNMDTSGYYTLFHVNGAHPATFNPVPIWLGTPPANSNLFSIITLGNSVFLSGSPIQVTSAAATPNPAGHGQTVTFAVNVTAGSHTINPNTGISLDASPLGGSSTLFLVQSNGTSVYTNSVVLANPALGQYALSYTVTDNNGDTINPTISFTVGGAPETWNGNAAPNNTWGSGLNWVGGSAPLTGDLLTFAGTHQLTPDMETSYTIGSLTFDNTAGSFNITNDGSGTLTLSGGATNNSANVQTLSVPVSLVGMPAFNAAAGNIVISNTVSDDGNGLIKAGANTLTLEGNNTYSGATSISNGTLVVDGTGQLGGGSYAPDITDNGTLTYNSSAAQTLSGIISGSGGLNQTGSGLLTLSGANTFSNMTTISAGTLTLNNSLALRNSTLNYNNGSLIFSGITTATLGGLSGTVGLSVVNDGSAAVALTVGGNNSTTAYSGDISDSSGSFGPGSLTKNGTGTLTLSGNLSFTGANTVNAGTLVLSGNNTYTGQTRVNPNATLQLQANGGNTVSDTSSAMGATSQLNMGGVNGSISTLQLRSDTNVLFSGGDNMGGLGGTGAGETINIDVSQLTSAGTNNTFAFASAGFQIFLTTINVTGGNNDTLALGPITAVGGAQTDVFTPTTGNLTVNGYTGSSGANILNLNGASAGNSVGGVIANGSGTLSVNKLGAGTWTLSAANTYTGATTISNGTLLVNGSIAGAASVNGGALGGNSTIGGAVTVNASGTLAPGTSAIGTLTVNNNLSLGGNTLIKLNKNLSPAQSNDMVNVTGTLAYGGTLTVTNLGSALAAGDSFSLFPAGGTGSVTVSGNAGAGLGFSFSPASGVLSVVTASAPLSALKFTASPVISGMSLTISATNTGAGTVYLLTTTNVAAAINTWTPIWTNVLTGNGSFTTNLPNAVNPALKQQFYILGNTNN